MKQILSLLALRFHKKKKKETTNCLLFGGSTLGYQLPHLAALERGYFVFCYKKITHITLFFCKPQKSPKLAVY